MQNTLAVYTYRIVKGVNHITTRDVVVKFEGNIEDFPGVLRVYPENSTILVKIASRSIYSSFNNLDLSNLDLNNLDLSSCHFYRSNLTSVNFTNTIFRNVYIVECILHDTNFTNSDLICSYIRDSDFTNTILDKTNLYSSDIVSSNVSGVDFTNTDITRTNFASSDLSQSKGLSSNKDLMDKLFERDETGWIVYKRIGLTEYKPNPSWKIEENSILEEVREEDRRLDCGRGVNFGTLEWVNNRYPYANIWKCHIPFSDIDLITVPHGTDGKARTSRLKLICIVKYGEIELE
jgi:hypothetical protein